MNQFLIILIFGLSLVIALAKGAKWAFVLVFLPSLILLNQVAGLTLQHVPVFAQYAPLYAILIAIPFRKETIKFKFGMLDAIVALLVLSAAMTGWTTEVFETGVNAFRNDLLRLGLPYFVARMVFKDWYIRRAALYVLAGVMAIVGMAALIECRMVPYFYLHLLQNAGMGNEISPMSYVRYGFFRVSGTVEHPIFFGNMALVLMGMVAVLAKTSGLRLRNPVVAATMLSCFVCVAVSISFTPYMAFIAGTIALVTLVTIPFTRKLVLPGTILVMLAGFGYTAYTAYADAGEKGDTQLEGSLFTRNMIIRQSWGKALKAGPFGFGLRADFNDDDDFDLASVDNSYLQFTMTRGWVYTALWLSIGVAFAARAGRAFERVTDPSQVIPLAMATATVLALMVSMYTVFAGALYTVVWIVMLGLSNTLIDSVLAAADAGEAAAYRAGMGRLRPPTVRMPAGAPASGRPLGLAQRV